MTAPSVDAEQVLAEVRADDVVELALALGNIDSPSGREHAVSDYLHDWCAAAGLVPRRLRPDPSRAANILATVPGRGDGWSLLFNSHMDTAVIPGDRTYFLEPDRPEFHGAWRDGDRLVGIGVVNDKGPMAAWLVAARALRRAGVALRGDVVLTMVTGEIGFEPVDEFQGLEHHGKDFGARYLATHGGLADFALVAETTHFRPIWVEAGKAFFKISVEGRATGVYTPYLQRPYPPAEHPSALVRAARLIPALEEWAHGYEIRHRYECPGGVVVPRVNIGAIRAGHPTQPILSPAVCHLYLDVRLPPGATPLAVRAELRGLLAGLGLGGTVEPYLFRRGYEAVGAEPLVAAIEAANALEVDPLPPAPAQPTASSMWRDINVFNELGIPAVTYGPGGGTGGGNVGLAVADLARAARAYTRIALDVCSRPRGG